MHFTIWCYWLFDVWWQNYIGHTILLSTGVFDEDSLMVSWYTFSRFDDLQLSNEFFSTLLINLFLLDCKNDRSARCLQVWCWDVVITPCSSMNIHPKCCFVCCSLLPTSSAMLGRDDMLSRLENIWYRFLVTLGFCGLLIAWRSSCFGSSGATTVCSVAAARRLNGVKQRLKTLADSSCDVTCFSVPQKFHRFLDIWFRDCRGLWVPTTLTGFPTTARPCKYGSYCIDPDSVSPLPECTDPLSPFMLTSCISLLWLYDLKVLVPDQNLDSTVCKWE
jgi:hypothetical protein